MELQFLPSLFEIFLLSIFWVTSFKDLVGWIEISIASIGIKFSNKAVLVPKTDAYKFEIKKLSCLKKGTNYNAV